LTLVRLDCIPNEVVGNEKKDDRAKCIEAGANDYLAKLVDLNKLLSLMRVWLYWG